MKKTDQLKQDYKKHGYRLKSQKDGVLVFDTDREYYKKNVDKDVHAKHPIFSNDHGEQIGSKSTCIIHSKCAHCNCYLIENKCPQCKRVYRIVTTKPHIPYPDEINRR